MGDLEEGWQSVDVLEPKEVENGIYALETVMRREVARAVPFVDIGDPVNNNQRKSF